ncbi:hypothetical protein MP638_001447 [Amoeboaphelidium occidentale]|nr:hypothetical protein MP638_001447 [Amoeboaphelidium occidentale]
MAKEIKEIKEFMEIARRNDATVCHIKKGADKVKFKLRTSKYLYTLVMDAADAEKVSKVEDSLPPSVKRELL